MQLAAACHSLGRSGKQTTILVNNDKVRAYLRSSGFVQLVQDIVHFQPPLPGMALFLPEERPSSNQLLIKVTKIHGGDELPGLLDRITHVLQSRLRYQKYDAFDIAVAVSEICQNTFEHAPQACGFFAMQVYQKRFLEIGVANPPIATDREAIFQAIQLGTSEFSDLTRGTGLHHLLEIAYKHEGSVHIRSGNAASRFRMDKKQGWSFPVIPMPGVQIAFTLPTKAEAGA